MSKTLGSDFEKNNLTLAIIHLFNVLPEEEKDEVVNSYLKGEKAQYKKAALVEMLKTYGSLDYTHRQAQEFAARAVQSLAIIQKSDAKDALVETAKFMAGRTT